MTVKPKRKRALAYEPVMVSGIKLAHHFGVVRQMIDKLTAQGVISRDPSGLFDQDVCRLKYFDHLRAEHRRSPASAANAEHAAARTQLLNIRIEEKRRTLVRRDEHEAKIDQIAGIVLTKLNGWPARVAGPDLVLRRKIEAAVRELRIEMSQVATALADEEGEPSLEEQAALGG